MSCTGVQRKWNAGTRNNVGLRKAKHINFKRHRTGHTYPGPSSLPPDLTTSTQHFKNHAEFVSHSNSSVIAPLFQLQTEGFLQLSFRADVDSDKTSSSEYDIDRSHTDHSLTQSCRKCLLFYESYIKLSPTQATTLMEETTVQSASQLWHVLYPVYPESSVSLPAQQRDYPNDLLLTPKNSSMSISTQPSKVILLQNMSKKMRAISSNS